MSQVRCRDHNYSLRFIPPHIWNGKRKSRVVQVTLELFKAVLFFCAVAWYFPRFSKVLLMYKAVRGAAVTRRILSKVLMFCTSKSYNMVGVHFGSSETLSLSSIILSSIYITYGIYRGFLLAYLGISWSADSRTTARRAGCLLPRIFFQFAHCNCAMGEIMGAVQWKVGASGAVRVYMGW